MPFVELCGNHDSYSIVSIQQQTSRYERRFSSTAQLLLLIQNNTRGLETKQSERNQERERVTISLLLFDPGPEQLLIFITTEFFKSWDFAIVSQFLI